MLTFKYVYCTKSNSDKPLFSEFLKNIRIGNLIYLIAQWLEFFTECFNSIACTSGDLVIQLQHGFSFKKSKTMQHRAQKLTNKF